MKQTTMNEQIAVDTNILLYTHFDDEPLKKKTALDILDLLPLISSQVISEYMNVLQRKMKLPKKEIIDICITNFDGCIIHTTTFETLKLSKMLINKYDFQLFDSIIVASALERNCKILYSEDMQNDLLVEKSMKIINPFFNI